MLILSPALTVIFGYCGAFGNSSQNGAYTGVVPLHAATSPVCSTVAELALKPSSPTQCADHAPLVAVTPVQSRGGAVNCADTKRKVVVPRLAAYPAQLTDWNLVTAAMADAAAPGPAPTAFSGLLGRIDAGTPELVTVVTAPDAGAKVKAPAVRATARAPTATPPARKGFLIRIPAFHARKPIGWTIWPASRLLMAATPPQLLERLRP